MAPLRIRLLSALLPVLMFASSSSNHTRANPWALAKDHPTTVATAPDASDDGGGKLDTEADALPTQLSLFLEEIEAVTLQTAPDMAATPKHRRLSPGSLAGYAITTPPRKPLTHPIHLDSHRHRGASRFGPYFEEGADGSNITARLGSTVMLDCKIGMLQDKTVTWLHQKDDAIHLLTVGRQTYSSDSRFALAYRYPSNWRLQISSVTKRDEGLYECQVATHPTRVRKVFLRVTAPELKIVDEDGHEVLERYYKAGSEVELTCIASHLEGGDREVEFGVSGGDSRGGTTPIVPPAPKGAEERAEWRHRGSVISNNTSGRGIGVRASADGRNVWVTLSLKSATKPDGGNYTCSVGGLASATVSIHILNGELPAAVQYGNSTVQFGAASLLLQLFSLSLTIITFLR